MQTYATYLPKGARIIMREEAGGVDSTNFLRWARRFVESVSDLTAHVRHILLTFDGFGAHLSLRFLRGTLSVAQNDIRCLGAVATSPVFIDNSDVV